MKYKVNLSTLTFILLILSCNKDINDMPINETPIIEEQAKVRLIDNISSRITDWENNDIDTVFYVYSKFKNETTEPIKIEEISTFFYDSLNNQIYSATCNVVCDDIVFGTSGYERSNYLVSNDIGWFYLRFITSQWNTTFNPYLVDSIDIRLEWENTSLKELNENVIIELNNPTIEIVSDPYQAILAKGKMINNNDFSIMSPLISIAALDDNDNILHLFNINRHGNIILKNGNYAFDGVNMKKALTANSSLDFATGVSETENNFPIQDISSFEVKNFWTNAQNITPIENDEIKITVISQSGNGGCASFHREVNNEEVRFFGGCGMSLNFRGYNIALLDPNDGTIKDFSTFDLWLGGNDESLRLENYIENIPDSTIVLLAIADEGNSGLLDSTRDLINFKLGSNKIYDVGFRDGLSLISVKGRNNPLIIEDYSSNNPGFVIAKVEANIMIPLD